MLLKTAGVLGLLHVVAAIAVRMAPEGTTVHTTTVYVTATSCAPESTEIANPGNAANPPRNTNDSPPADSGAPTITVALGPKVDITKFEEPTEVIPALFTNMEGTAPISRTRAGLGPKSVKADGTPSTIIWTVKYKKGTSVLENTCTVGRITATIPQTANLIITINAEGGTEGFATMSAGSGLSITCIPGVAEGGNGNGGAGDSGGAGGAGETAGPDPLLVKLTLGPGLTIKNFVAYIKGTPTPKPAEFSNTDTLPGTFASQIGFGSRLVKNPDIVWQVVYEDKAGAAQARDCTVKTATPDVWQSLDCPISLSLNAKGDEPTTSLPWTCGLSFTCGPSAGGTPTITPGNTSPPLLTVGLGPGLSISNFKEFILDPPTALPTELPFINKADATMDVVKSQIGLGVASAPSIAWVVTNLSKPEKVLVCTVALIQPETPQTTMCGLSLKLSKTTGLVDYERSSQCQGLSFICTTPPAVTPPQVWVSLGKDVSLSNFKRYDPKTGVSAAATIIENNTGNVFVVSQLGLGVTSGGVTTPVSITWEKTTKQTTGVVKEKCTLSLVDSKVPQAEDRIILWGGKQPEGKSIEEWSKNNGNMVLLCGPSTDTTPVGTTPPLIEFAIVHGITMKDFKVFNKDTSVSPAADYTVKAGEVGSKSQIGLGSETTTIKWKVTAKYEEGDAIMESDCTASRKDGKAQKVNVEIPLTFDTDHKLVIGDMTPKDEIDFKCVETVPAATLPAALVWLVLGPGIKVKDFVEYKKDVPAKTDIFDSTGDVAHIRAQAGLGPQADGPPKDITWAIEYKVGTELKTQTCTVSSIGGATQSSDALFVIQAVEGDSHVPIKTHGVLNFECK